MRELLEKGRQIMIVPTDFKNVNKGVITEVSTDGFKVELDYEPEGFLRRNYCEFYTQNQYGTLYFTSFPQEIKGKTLRIANPAKHKYLQRRQYTRVKYFRDLEISDKNGKHKIHVLDVSAGGMKFTSKKAIDIDSKFSVELPLSSVQSVKCKFSPIRIEKGKEYTVSGMFIFSGGKGKMLLTQYCAKKNIELRNK